MWTALEKAISNATGVSFTADSSEPVPGGCINEAFCLAGEGTRYFVKVNRAGALPMFEAEAAGLEEIRRSSSVQVPDPVCTGQDNNRSWLVLEFIAMKPPGPATSHRLGEQLAIMHRHTASMFGWSRENTIGSTPQPNTLTRDWITFLRDYRIGYQLQLASEQGAPGELLDRGQRLLECLPLLFTDYQPRASLLHGDLWAGNWGCATDGAPVLFDPAVYYGDREADLAMTELFGGFDDRFYQSYRHAWTLDPGYKTRKVLYNLYHVLNHFNLFGGSYARQACGMVDTLISEIS